MNKMLLTIILPCYNVEKYIGACLDSVYRQDIPLEEYEVICVDDCSKDSTKEIIRTYQKRYSNITLIEHTINQTAGGARNSGIEAARGEYIWFVDPDDMLIDNVLADALKKCQENQLDILMFNFKKVNGFEQQIYDVNLIYEDSEVCDGYTFLDRYGEKNIGKHSIVWQRLYRRGLIENSILRYPFIRVSEDAIFSWKALFKAKRVQSETIPRYIYRSNPDSIAAFGCNNADKVYARDILMPLELYKWINKDSSIRYDYLERLENVIRHYVSIVGIDYLTLNSSERTKLFHLLRGNTSLLKNFSKCVGKKNYILYISLFFGEWAFRMICLRLKR